MLSPAQWSVINIFVLQTFASLAGKLELTTPRDAFITALCKSCLPPHYTLTVLNNANSAVTSGANMALARGHQRSPSAESAHQYYDSEVSCEFFKDMF